MASKCHVFLVVSCLMVGAQSQPDPNVCIPHGPTGEGPPLPLLPEQFMLTVEANILGWNQTLEVVEYYDSINNRGAVHNIVRGIVSQTVINYKTREIITNSPGTGCSVQNLTDSSFNIFGFELQNGTAHIGSVADIFKFGASYNETYIGTTSVRGIPCNHWQSCLYNEDTNGTSLLEYYFAVPKHLNAAGDSQIPLRLVLNGTASNRKFIDGHLVPVNGTHSFSHVYEFFDVRFRPVFPDRAFEPQLGVVCPGRKSVKPLPRLPNQFSLSLEVVSAELKKVFYVSEIYNYKSKMVASYYGVRTNGSTVTTLYRLLDDFNTGLSYLINLNTGSCNVTPISLMSPDAESDDHVHVQMKTVASFLHYDTVDWQYQGITEIRSIPTESWIGILTDWKPFWFPNAGLDHVNSTWQFFFTVDSWKTQEGLNMSASMPIMGKVSWTIQTDSGKVSNGSFDFNYFQFNTFKVDPSHFDISFCFDSENSKELAFDILETGIFNTVIANNTVAFYHGVTHSLATAASVSPARITHMFAAEDNDKVTTVFFDLLGVPAVKGDAVDMITEPSLADALVALEMLINVYKDDTPFRVQFDDNGTEKSLTVKPDTLRNNFKQSQPKDGGSQPFSTGAFIGFGVGMMIVGAALGVGILVFLRKRNNIPYNVQS